MSFEVPAVDWNFIVMLLAMLIVQCVSFYVCLIIFSFMSSFYSTITSDEDVPFHLVDLDYFE